MSHAYHSGPEHSLYSRVSGICCGPQLNNSPAGGRVKVAWVMHLWCCGAFTASIRFTRGYTGVLRGQTRQACPAPEKKGFYRLLFGGQNRFRSHACSQCMSCTANKQKWHKCKTLTHAGLQSKSKLGSLLEPWGNAHLWNGRIGTEKKRILKEGKNIFLLCSFWLLV